MSVNWPPNYCMELTRLVSLPNVQAILSRLYWIHILSLDPSNAAMTRNNKCSSRRTVYFKFLDFISFNTEITIDRYIQYNYIIQYFSCYMNYKYSSFNFIINRYYKLLLPIGDINLYSTVNTEIIWLSVLQKEKCIGCV